MKSGHRSSLKSVITLLRAFRPGPSDEGDHMRQQAGLYTFRWWPFTLWRFGCGLERERTSRTSPRPTCRPRFIGLPPCAAYNKFRSLWNGAYAPLYKRRVKREKSQGDGRSLAPSSLPLAIAYLYCSPPAFLIQVLMGG